MSIAYLTVRTLVHRSLQKNCPNYRPVAILPILHKLFSRMLCARTQPGLIHEQSAEQTTYRQGLSTEDHLLSITLLLEKCLEWNCDLWFGLIDF